MEHGYALVMTVPPNVKYQDLFLKLQREAREAKGGVVEVRHVYTALPAAILLRKRLYCSKPESSTKLRS